MINVKNANVNNVINDDIIIGGVMNDRTAININNFNIKVKGKECDHYFILNDYIEKLTT